MTEKELMYLEDAIGHEQNIIKIVNNTLNELTNEELKKFLSNELSIHQERNNKLLNLLEEKSK